MVLVLSEGMGHTINDLCVLGNLGIWLQVHVVYLPVHRPHYLFSPQLAYWIGSSIVTALSFIDKSLEERELVDKLIPNQNGVEQCEEGEESAAQECNEVIEHISEEPPCENGDINFCWIFVN